VKPRARTPLGLAVSLVLAASVALGAALALAGCGLGPGTAPTAVRLLITREFGATTLRDDHEPNVLGQETVMSLLMRNFAVSTRYSGGFVQSIDGQTGGNEGGHPVDWFYYVNGVEASKGAASTNVNAGDHVWWDLHDWSQTQDVPAVVGSFPEPFLNGVGGKRLPVRIECEAVTGSACRTVAARLRARGVPAAIAAPSSVPGADTIRVLVGIWNLVRGDQAAAGLAKGPAASGVYARFTPSGALTLLDPDGHPTRTLTTAGGLIAATRHEQDAPAWVVTGTDRAGVELAARAFDDDTLDGRFAVAVAGSGSLAVPTPREPR
jgi:hypothetical protein